MIVFKERFCSSLSVFIIFGTITKSVSLTLSEIDFDSIDQLDFKSEDYEWQHTLYPQHEEFYEVFNVPIQNRHNSSREKRQVTIMFPPRSILVTDYYINIPLLAPAHVFIPLTLQARSFFVLPRTELNFGNFARSLKERFNLFKSAEDILESFGLDGRTCILRALCEKSEYHILTDGLLSEAVSLLLEFSSPSGDISFKDYEIATQHGRTKGSCYQKYSTCPISIFTFIDENFL